MKMFSFNQTAKSTLNYIGLARFSNVGSTNKSGGLPLYLEVILLEMSKRDGIIHFVEWRLGSTSVSVLLPEEVLDPLLELYLISQE